MHVDVAVAGAGLDGGDLRVLHAGADEPGAAARDEDVDEADGPEELGGARVPGVVGHIRNRRGGKARADAGLAAQRGYGEAGVVGRAAALEQARIARAKAQREGVGGHVRARLVDHGDDAEGYRHLLDAQAVRVHVAADDAPERVRLRRDLIHGGGDRANAPLVEHEPIEEPIAHARLAGPRHIAGVGDDDVARAVAQQPGGSADGSRARLRGGGGDVGGGVVGRPGQFKRKSHGNPLS